MSFIQNFIRTIPDNQLIETLKNQSYCTIIVKEEQFETIARTVEIAFKSGFIYDVNKTYTSVEARVENTKKNDESVPGLYRGERVVIIDTTYLEHLSSQYIKNTVFLRPEKIGKDTIDALEGKARRVWVYCMLDDLNLADKPLSR